MPNRLMSNSYLCTSCNNKKPKWCFSGNQLKKSKQIRRCKKCIKRNEIFQYQTGNKKKQQENKQNDDKTVSLNKPSNLDQRNKILKMEEHIGDKNILNNE
eukprot:179914_1